MFSLTKRLIIGATLGLLALAATPAQAQRFIPPRVLAGYLRLQMTPPFMLSPLYRPAITPAEIAMTADALRFRNIYPDGPALSVATPGFAYPSTLSSMYSGYPGGYSNPYPAYYPGSYGSMGYGSMGYGGGGYGGAGGIASLLGLFMNGGSTQYSYPNMDSSAGNYGDSGRPGVMGRGTAPSARSAEARNERKESRPADKVRDYLYGPVPKEKEKEKAPARERLQPTVTEITAGDALNDLLAQLQKRPADEGAKQPATAALALDDQVLRHIHVTRGSGSLAVIGNDGNL